MAVVMTTKFYEEYTPAWHDLSKVVFTSPNIASPNAAGMRSHILPGNGDLALWYEDTANMYEIEPIQNTYDTSFYYYHFDVVTDIDLDSNPTSALITFGNYPQFVTFVKNETGVEVIGFTSVNSDVIDETLKLEYTMMIELGLSYIYNDSTTSDYTQGSISCVRSEGETYSSTMPIEVICYRKGWKVEIIPDIEECYIYFEFLEPINITYIVMEASSKRVDTYTADCDLGTYAASLVTTAVYYFIGNFKIQGKTDIIGASWVDLYTGSNISNVTKNIFMMDNTEYYTYYRILILNNDSLTTPTEGTFDIDHYSIAGLKFYGYEYSTDPGTGQTTLHSFDDDINNRELHVTNVISVAGTPVNTEYNTNTNVEGTINISAFINDDVLTTKYIVDMDEVGISAEDYHTYAVGTSVSPVISGTTGTNGTVGTTNIIQDAGVLINGYMDVTGETKIENGYIYSNLDGQQSGLTYSNSKYDIITDIVYTTTVSGAVTSGTIGDVAVTGYTNRYEDRYSAERDINCFVSLTGVVGTGTVVSGTTLYLWKQKADLEGVEFSTHDSIVFEITQGEAYDCRLTAWDDVTHSTTLNYLISGDYVRVSALAFRAEGTVLTPESSTTINNYIASPVYNRIFKGNVVYNGTNYYYGDFDLSHRTEPDMIGDYLIFKPMLYGVDDSIPYGIHDHVIVLHYNYT